VWSELFAARLGVPAAAGPAWLNAGSNYAVGGATTGTSGILGTPTGMLSQGAQFAVQHPGGVPANGLFVLWGGGNDIINAVSLPTPAARLQAVQQAVTNLATLAGGLFSNFGATNFLIPSLPDVGIAPLYAGDPTSAAIATGLTTAFNQLLGASIMQLDALPGVNAFGLNLNNLLTNIRIDAAQGGPRYGITNTTIPCFQLPNPATACNSALFVDGRHPTTRANALIADAAFNRVVLNTDVAVVPEPATLALVAAGLLLTAVASHGRRKSHV